MSTGLFLSREEYEFYYPKEKSMTLTSRTLSARASSIKKMVSAKRLAELSGITHHSILHAIQRGSIKATPIGSVTVKRGRLTYTRPEGYKIQVGEVRRFLLKRAAKLKRLETAAVSS